MTIDVYHSKGGVAKTSLVVHLARLWSDRGVTVYDVDHQQATKLYSAHLPEVEFVYCDAVEVARRLDPGRVNLIDCPPFPHLARPVFHLADLVLIPFTSERAVWNEVEPCRKDVLTETAGLTTLCKAVISRFYPERPRSQAVKKMAEKKLGANLLSTVIRNLAVFDEAAFEGKTVLDYAPDSLAAKKIKALGMEIDALMEARD